MIIKGYAAMNAGEELSPFEYEPVELGPLDAEVEIEYCGLCHTDIHLIDNDMDNSEYPFIPGHEIVGKVSAAGELVEGLKPGQRVAVGWQRSSCMVCEWCLRGRENSCPDQEATCVGHHGGFADKIRTDARFVFPLPDRLDPACSGPLLCGGITVFTPLRERVRSIDRVGIIGIGGLGHFGVQFASSFGCEVTAFSTSPEKQEEVMRMGATTFVHSADDDLMEKTENTQDLIISTVNADLDWEPYIKALRPEGTLCFVGVVHGRVELPYFELLAGHKSVTGSTIGDRSTIAEMLEFAARHEITAESETMPMERVNEAIEKLRSGNARYRIVLKNE